MANNIGIKVLHPGGYKSTKELLSRCNINKELHVLDLACGTGTTSYFIHKLYNCKVTGIDISEDLIAVANKNLSKRKQDNINFQVADALALPFPGNSFDVVVAQAFFILIDEKEQALREISRVLKPGGHFGSLELSWLSVPTKNAYNELKEKTCSDFIPRVKSSDEWQKFFETQNLKHISTSKKSMDSGMLKLMQSEGLLNFIRIMFRMIANSKMRKRMMFVQDAFRKHNNYLGHSIFSFIKENDSRE